MREIKFRAWSPKMKAMLSWEIVKGMMAELLLTESEANIPMQYTGLKDRNEKEIFDGDICLIDTKRGREKTEINIQYIWEAIGYRNAKNDIAMNLEVIGNIYENPELLKEQS